MGFLISLLMANVMFRIILGIIAIATYVLTSIGFYTLSKRRGISYAWIAWIPFLQNFLLGKLIGDRLWGIPYASWILLLGPAVIGLVTSLLHVTGFVYSAIFAVYYIYLASAEYKLYEIYKPDLALIYLISGFIIAPLQGLWIFLIRNNQPRLPGSNYPVY